MNWSGIIDITVVRISLLSGRVTYSSDIFSNFSDWLSPIAMTYAPRAITSCTLLVVLSNKWFWLAVTIIGVPSSIKAKVPCFSSPAANASACKYEISFSFKAPSAASA